MSSKRLALASILLATCFAGPQTRLTAETNKAHTANRHWTLVILKGRYPNGNHLPGQAARADSLKASLLTAGCAEDRISTLADDSDRETSYPPVTQDNVDWAVSRIVEQARAGESVLVLMGGHGTLAGISLGNDNLLSFDHLHQSLAKSQAEKILYVVDACRVQCQSSFPSRQQHGSSLSTCVWLYTCPAGAVAYRSTDFLTIVAKGLKAADASSDGRVTGSELFKFVQQNMQTSPESPVLEVQLGSAEDTFWTYVEPKVEDAKPHIVHTTPPISATEVAYDDVQCVRCRRRGLKVTFDGVVAAAANTWTYLILSIHPAEDLRVAHRDAQGMAAIHGQWVAVGADGHFSVSTHIPGHTVNNPSAGQRLAVKATVYKSTTYNGQAYLTQQLAASGHYALPQLAETQPNVPSIRVERPTLDPRPFKILDAMLRRQPQATHGSAADVRSVLVR